MGYNWKMSDFKTWGEFWMIQVQVMQSVIGRCQVGGKWNMLLHHLLTLGVCSLSVLGSSKIFLMPVLIYGSDALIWKEKRQKFS